MRRKVESVRRALRPPVGSFFLLGPRGTGKSRWVKEHFPQALLIDLLDPATYRRLASHPEELVALVRPLKPSTAVIIDEVQKAPVLLEVVHSLMEESKGHRFVLTGSSARKLKRGHADLLAGRATSVTMHPFTAHELGTDFDIDEALALGLLPVVTRPRDSEPSEVLSAYVALYLREEVQMEGLVRNTQSFARFLESASFSHGQLLNVSDVARDCAVERKSVVTYFEILEDLLLAFRVGVFNKRQKRELVTHKKFYLFDPGVFRSIRPAGPLDKPGEIGGAALEGLVAQQLRAWLAYSGSKAELFFWRTRHGVEVDFVLYGPKTFVAIEVKSAQSVASRELSGLRAFGEDYPQARLIFLYMGTERLRHGEIECIPVDEFLRDLAPRIDAFG